MKRSGRSDPSGPARIPHASSGWSRRACATIASTRSRCIRSTPPILGCGRRCLRVWDEGRQAGQRSGGADTVPDGGAEDVRGGGAQVVERQGAGQRVGREVDGTGGGG